MKMTKTTKDVAQIVATSILGAEDTVVKTTLWHHWQNLLSSFSTNENLKNIELIKKTSVIPGPCCLAPNLYLL